MAEIAVSSKGQIVVPKEIREPLRLREGDRVSVEVEGDHVTITPIQTPALGDWRKWCGRLAGTRALEDHIADHADEVSSKVLDGLILKHEAKRWTSSPRSTHR